MCFTCLPRSLVVVTVVSGTIWSAWLNGRTLLKATSVKYDFMGMEFNFSPLANEIAVSNKIVNKIKRAGNLLSFHSV